MGVPGFVLAGLLLLTLEDPPTAGLGKYGDARGVGASGDGASGDESEAALEGTSMSLGGSAWSICQRGSIASSASNGCPRIRVRTLASVAGV